MSATLTITDAPALDEGVRRLVLACTHGTTTMHLVGPASEAHALTAVRLALWRHEDAVDCACTAALRERYLRASLLG